VTVIQHGESFEMFADLDGKRILSYKGKNDAVTSIWAPDDPKYLGLAGFRTEVTWSSVKVRMLSGRLTKDEPPAKDAPAKEPPPKDAPAKDAQPKDAPPAKGKGTNGDGNNGNTGG
jgi:hypothetical protein